MGVVRTLSNFCFIECDRTGCNRKMEHIDEKILKQLAKLCKWENNAELWLCPECAQKEIVVEEVLSGAKKGKKRARS